MDTDPLEGAAEISQPPVIEPGYTISTVTDKISSIVLGQRKRPGWFLGFAVSFVLLLVLLYAVTVLFAIGVGIWGINIPVGWASRL